MNRDQRRDTALAVLKTYHRAGKILDKDVSTFEVLIRRCRTTDEYYQVTGAIRHYVQDIKTASDRYAQILRDDIIED